VMGTVGYMSPEQVKGLATDHRSDIFSFGVILYELLSGKRAFKRATNAETLAAILRDEPPELSAAGRSIPMALDHVVQHCLEKEPENRFQTVKDVAFALSEASSPTATSGASAPRIRQPLARGKLAMMTTVILVLAGAGLLLWRRTTPVSPASGVKRIVVLPFENLGAPQDDYFADGIADDVRAKLTSVPGLEVIARGSSTPYKKANKTPKQIADELSANYLLTATVRWQQGGGASRVHVTPELVEVKESGAPVSRWQQPFDAALTDVFQVQSDIASRVTEALGIALAEGQEKRLAERPTENLAAYDAFLKGEETSMAMSTLDPTNLTKALRFYDQAVALDPTFAQAWARVSNTNSLLYANSTPTRPLADRAREGAEKAIALAPARPEGYVALGTYYRLVSLDLSSAIEKYEKAERLAPASVDLLGGAAIVEAGLGRWDAALRRLKELQRRDPRSVNTVRRLGEVLVRLRRYPEAHAMMDRALELAPANVDVIMGKIETFLGEGDLAGARAFLRTASKRVEPTELFPFVAGYNDVVWILDREQAELLLTLTPSAFDGDLGAWGLGLAEACALKGDKARTGVYAEEARKAYELAVRATPDADSPHVGLGLSFAYLGRKEDAVREGLRAVSLHPVSKDEFFGPFNQHQLARIYILVGEPEKALDQLEPLLKIPYNLSPGWLKIDPNFDPLRGNPRFQKLAAGA